MTEDSEYEIERTAGGKFTNLDQLAWNYNMPAMPTMPAAAGGALYGIIEPCMVFVSIVLLYIILV